LVTNKVTIDWYSSILGDLISTLSQYSQCIIIVSLADSHRLVYEGTLNPILTVERIYNNAYVDHTHFLSKT